MPAHSVAFADGFLTKRFRFVRRVSVVHVDGGVIKRVRVRTFFALLTAAAALAVGMVQTADAKPPTHSPVSCSQPGGCTALGDHQL
jgi:hypothetical protein